MRKLHIVFFILALFICIPANHILADVAPLSGSIELFVPKSNAVNENNDIDALIETFEITIPKSPVMDAETISVDNRAWYPMGTPQGSKGDLWEQGKSVDDINRRRVPADSSPSANAGLDTRAGIDTQLKSISEYERSLDEDPITIANGKIRSESSIEQSSWKSNIVEPVKIDEPVLTSQHNVFGAYADMVEDEDFHMSAGAELHLPESNTSILGSSSERQDNSEIGMGMKLMWGF